MKGGFGSKVGLVENLYRPIGVDVGYGDQAIQQRFEKKVTTAHGGFAEVGNGDLGRNLVHLKGLKPGFNRILAAQNHRQADIQ